MYKSLALNYLRPMEYVIVGTVGCCRQRQSKFSFIPTHSIPFHSISCIPFHSLVSFRSRRPASLVVAPVPSEAQDPRKWSSQMTTGNDVCEGRRLSSGGTRPIETAMIMDVSLRER